MATSRIDQADDRPVLGSSIPSARAGAVGAVRARVRDLCDLAWDGVVALGFHPGATAGALRLVIEIGDGQVAFWGYDHLGQATVLAVSPFVGPQFGALIKDAMIKSGAAADSLAISVSDGLTLDLDATFPVATLPQLDRSIGHYVSRETPFPPREGLAFWTIERPEWTHARARISIVPASLVLPVLAELRAVGVRPAFAVRDPGDRTRVARPAWLDGRRATMRHRFFAFSRAGRMAVFAVVGIFASWGANYATAAFALWTTTETVDRAREAGQMSVKAETDARFLAGRQRVAVLKLRVLDSMAERLPASTWLDRIELKEGKFEIVGFAPSAADALKLISAIPGVKNAELTSSVTRDTAQNIERFRLSADFDDAVKP
jgi:Fimbrial assembly protein (PilN)